MGLVRSSSWYMCLMLPFFFSVNEHFVNVGDILHFSSLLSPTVTKQCSCQENRNETVSFRCTAKSPHCQRYPSECVCVCLCRGGGGVWYYFEVINSKFKIFLKVLHYKFQFYLKGKGSYFELIISEVPKDHLNLPPLPAPHPNDIW